MTQQQTTYVYVKNNTQSPPRPILLVMGDGMTSLFQKMLAGTGRPTVTATTLPQVRDTLGSNPWINDVFVVTTGSDIERLAAVKMAVEKRKRTFVFSDESSGSPDGYRRLERVCNETILKLIGSP